MNDRKVLISPFGRDFLRYDNFYLSVSEGVTGSGKTVMNSFKFITCVFKSKYKYHIISCRNKQKTEQNLINDDVCGILAMFDGLVHYYPHGHLNTSTSHLSVQGDDGKEKIIYFISYNDSTQWEAVRGGRFGCSYVDEVNEVRHGTNEEETSVPRFITEIMSRTNEKVFFTLNPDDPDKPIYNIINKCRPVKYYEKKGPAEIRKYLTAPENPRWKWWFWDFEDNLAMTPELIQIAKDGCEGSPKDYASRILGLRCKAESLAFPAFCQEHILDEGKIEKQFKFYTDKDGNQHAPEKKFIAFYAGVDTSYSHKTDDLMAFIFIGFTDTGELYVLDEWTYNNRDHIEAERITAHILRDKLEEFLQRNSKKWGYPLTTFVDEADAGFLTELIVNPISSFDIHKTLKFKFPVETRYNLIKGMIAKKRYYVNANCGIHIHEMSVIAVDKKNNSRPEDKNNHTYDALCYAIEELYFEGRIII